MNLLADLQVALPEALLAGYGLAALLLAAIGGDRISVLLRILTSFALATAAVFAFIQFPQGDAEAFNDLYRVTPFVLFAKGATYALAALALLMSGGFLRAASMERYEYSLLVVFAAMGAGVDVVYGVRALWAHVKCVLVIGREGEGGRRYVHMGTDK